MHARVSTQVYAEPWTVEYVARVSPVPLLIVHNGLDTLVRRSDSEALFSVAREPKAWIYAPTGLHAWPDATASQVLDWMDKVL